MTRFKFISGIVALSICVGSVSVLFADQVEGQASEDFLVSPVHLTLQLPNNKNISICIAGLSHKTTKEPGIGVALAGPNKSCPKDTIDYTRNDGRYTQGLTARQAKFEGDPFEPSEMDGTPWLYKSRPSTIYYRTDGLTGPSEGQWAEIVASVIYPDPRKSKETGLKILTFKPKRVEGVDKTAVAVAGNISRAIQDKITTEKPNFIGDLKELEKLTANAKKEDDHGVVASTRPTMPPVTQQQTIKQP